MRHRHVIPAHAGILKSESLREIPAYAGMTIEFSEETA